MADLRIADAPEIDESEVQGGLKIPTGGFGNKAINMTTVANWVVKDKDLPSKGYVDDKFNQGNQGLSGHVANKNNPHEVTKEQVGLGSVDNTADADKPISNATSAALNLKADKSQLQGLATTTQLDLKADKSTTYTKTEVDGVVDDLYQLLEDNFVANGAALPYDPQVTYNDGAIVVDGGALKKVEGGALVNAVDAKSVSVGDSTLDVFASEVEISADKIITPMNFGALGDGTGRLVSDFYPNITEARRKFPNLTSMSLTIDSAACNEWILSAKGSHYLGDKTKHYVLNTDISDAATQNFLIKFPAPRQILANKAKISVLSNCPMFYGIFGSSDASVNLNDSSVRGVIIDHNSQNREYSVADNVLIKPNFDFCYFNGVDCEFENNIILNAVQTNSVYANNYALNKRGKIKSNTYINCGSDTIEFDHSTFYTHGADFEIKDNKGITTLGKKGVACFVEIHSTETRIQNNYCYGYGGFCNYTGISNVGVLENGIVSGNVFECVQFGVRVFSAKLLHNIGTHGINGLEIQSNKGKIHQNLLEAGTQKMYIGYGVQAGSNLDVKNLFIKGNSIEYALDATAQQYNALSCAIGINESSGTAVYENVEIGGNTIINAPLMAIGLGFGGGILKNVHVLPNTIINAAQGLHASFATYKSAINIAPNKIEGYLKIDEQSITDSLTQTRLVNSVSITPVVDSTTADIQVRVNTILQGDKASFVRSVANSGNKSLPLIDAKLNKQPAFTGHNFKAGSKIKNTLNNSDYLNVDNTSVFKLSSNSEAFNPPEVAAGDTITRQVSLFGARSGDFVIANFTPKDTNIALSCDVLNNDIVTVTFKNTSSADIDLPSGTLTVKAI